MRLPLLAPHRRTLGRRGGQGYRATGLGSALLEQAETKAKSLGAHSAKLDTFEWQAPDFYAKRGYQEFGRIDNHTNGFYLAFMMKKL